MAGLIYSIPVFLIGIPLVFLVGLGGSAAVSKRLGRSHQSWTVSVAAGVGLLVGAAVSVFASGQLPWDQIALFSGDDSFVPKLAIVAGVGAALFIMRRLEVVGAIGSCLVVIVLWNLWFWLPLAVANGFRTPEAEANADLGLAWATVGLLILAVSVGVGFGYLAYRSPQLQDSELPEDPADLHA